jgi:hypothetical protein
MLYSTDKKNIRTVFWLNLFMISWYKMDLGQEDHHPDSSVPPQYITDLWLCNLSPYMPEPVCRAEPNVVIWDMSRGGILLGKSIGTFTGHQFRPQH